MSRSGSSKPDQDLKGVELLFHQKGGSASLGTKMALSLNGGDLSCMYSITGSTCRAKCWNILHDSLLKSTSLCCYAEAKIRAQKFDEIRPDLLSNYHNDHTESTVVSFRAKAVQVCKKRKNIFWN